MAWIHGNDPSGHETSIGQILCEAMYACNEKEEAIGMAQSTWNGGAIGAKPGMNALDGECIANVGSTVLAELQTEIGDITTNPGATWYADASYNKYTLPNLCNDAFGGAGFTTVQHSVKANVTVVEEVLKCLELLDRIRIILDYVVAAPNDPRRGIKSTVLVGPGSATRAAAWTLCQAQAPAWSSGPAIPMLRHEWCDIFGAPPNIYGPYELVEFLTKYVVPVLTAYNAIDAVFIEYDVGAHTLGFYTQPNPNPRLYNISAAQYAAPDIWGPEGTLVLTYSIPAAPAFDRQEQLTDVSWWTGDNTTYYFKEIEPTAVEFPNDATADSFAMGGWKLIIFYDCTWTYN